MSDSPIFDQLVAEFRAQGRPFEGLLAPKPKAPTKPAVLNDDTLVMRVIDGDKKIDLSKLPITPVVPLAHKGAA